MNCFKNLVFPFLLIINSTFLFGQSANLRTTKYSLEQGLSHRLVTRIEKDHLGFIWLATPNGLNRFDGYEFLHFSPDKETEYPISGEYIGEIELVADNKMAILYKDNLTNFDFFDPISFSVQPIIFKDIFGATAEVLSISPIKKSTVNVLWKEHNRYFLSKISNKGIPILLYELPKSDFKWSEKITLYSFKNDEFFIFDGLNGLFQLSQNKIVPIPIDKVEFGEKEAQTLNFFKEDKQGRKWLSVYNMLGVYQLNQTKKQFQLFSTPIKNGFIPRMWEDEKGNLLFGQSKTLFHPVYNHFYLLDNKGKWLDLSYFKDLGQFIVDIDSKNFIETTFFATVSGFKVAVNKSSIVKKLLTFQEEEQQ